MVNRRRSAFVDWGRAVGALHEVNAVLGICLVPVALAKVRDFLLVRCVQRPAPLS